MRNAFRLAAFFSFLVLLPTASATDVTGTWKGSFDFEGAPVAVTFHLTATGNAVTGTVLLPQRAAVEIHDGRMAGDTITFWAYADYEGRTYKLVYLGKISAGQIEFTFGTEDGGWGAAVTARKSEEPAAVPGAGSTDVTGTWKGSFDFEGAGVAVTFHLKSAGDTVTGTVEGLPTTPAEIHDGKVDGDTVTFWVNTDYQGQTYKLVFKGKVSADGIKFSFGTEEKSWETEMTATKSL
jgi:hypothetical protein